MNTPDREAFAQWLYYEFSEHATEPVPNWCEQGKRYKDNWRGHADDLINFFTAHTGRLPPLRF